MPVLTKMARQSFAIARISPQAARAYCRNFFRAEMADYVFGRHATRVASALYVAA